MAAEAGPDPSDPRRAHIEAGAASGFWARIHEHKVIQWGVGYLGAALALAHGAELVSHALHWPDVIWRGLVIALIVGFPIALTVAWYHGHKGFTQMSQGELAIVSVLVLIGAVFFTATLRPAADHAAGTAPGAAESASRANASPPAAPRSEATEPARSAAAVLANSVAVLPLESLSTDPDNALYANGMHAEIIGQLTKLRNVTVINRDSVLRYAENRPSMRQIADELRVESLLTGRFQYAAGRIRVGVELVDPASGANLWNETYEREFAEVFTVQADIAMNVANALQAEFSAEEQARIERRPTESAVAYGLLLEARSLTGIGDQAPRIHALLDRAIEIDPKFAEAYGLKAAYYAGALINTPLGSARNPEELEPLITEYSDKALSLEPDNALALGARAGLSAIAWRWTEAEDAVERHYELTGFSLLQSTWFRFWSGNEADALRVAVREIDLNPLRWEPRFTYGIVLNYARDYSTAVGVFREGIALAPTVPVQHAWLATTEIARGNIEEGRRELRLTEQLVGENRNIITLIDVAYGFGRIGEIDDARRLFTEIDQATRRGQDIGTGGRAVLHMAVGEHDAALEWLRRGAEKAARHEYDAGFYSLMNLKLNYTNDPALERPEFVEVRNRLRGD